MRCQEEKWTIPFQIGGGGELNSSLTVHIRNSLGSRLLALYYVNVGSEFKLVAAQSSPTPCTHNMIKRSRVAAAGSGVAAAGSGLAAAGSGVGSRQQRRSISSGLQLAL
ncbi:hypothetical protein AgCh_006980 [Apium graveolens]